MFYIAEKDIAEATDMICAAAAKMRDGNGLKVSACPDPVKMFAGILKLVGDLTYGETPVCFHHGKAGPQPVTTDRVDLTDFLRIRGNVETVISN